MVKYKRMKLRWVPGVKSLCWNINTNIYDNNISRSTGICKATMIIKNKYATLSWKNSFDFPHSWINNKIIKCKELTQ